MKYFSRYVQQRDRNNVKRWCIVVDLVAVNSHRSVFFEGCAKAWSVLKFMRRVTRHVHVQSTKNTRLPTDILDIRLYAVVISTTMSIIIITKYAYCFYYYYYYLNVIELFKMSYLTWRISEKKKEEDGDLIKILNKLFVFIIPRKSVSINSIYTFQSRDESRKQSIIQLANDVACRDQSVLQ